MDRANPGRGDSSSRPYTSVWRQAMSTHVAEGSVTGPNASITRKQWLMLGTLTLATFVVYCNNLIVGPLVVELGQALNVGVAEVGQLVSRIRASVRRGRAHLRAPARSLRSPLDPDRRPGVGHALDCGLWRCY